MESFPPITWEQLKQPISGKEADKPEPRSKLELRQLIKLPRIPLGDIVSAVLGESVEADSFRLTRANIIHQVVEMAVANWKSKDAPEWCRQPLNNIFISTSAANLERIKAAIEFARQEKDQDGISVDLGKLASKSLAAIKYEGKLNKKDSLWEAKAKSKNQRSMFVARDLFPSPNYVEIAQLCRPAILTLIHDEKLMDGTLRIESKNLTPVNEIARTIVNIFDFSGNGEVRDLNTFMVRKDALSAKAHTYANQLMNLISTRGGQLKKDRWGEERQKIFLTVADSDFGTTQVEPGEYEILLSVHPKNPGGEVTKVSLNQEEITDLSEKFNKALREFAA